MGRHSSSTSTLGNRIYSNPKEGQLPGNLNETYITLNPNKDMLETYNDYSSMSLFIRLYNMISKMISDRIKPILLGFILEEQFGFFSK